MKILKLGDEALARRKAFFACPVCGCQWLANHDEYILQPTSNSEDDAKPYMGCPSCACINPYGVYGTLISDEEYEFIMEAEMHGDS